MKNVGARLRARREHLKLTVKVVANASGVSARYISSAEHGQANLSLDKLDRLCAALEIPIGWLVSHGLRGEVDALLVQRSEAELQEISRWLHRTYGGDQTTHIALLGVRGAGKTAVGRRLALRLEHRFIELDARIADRAELSLAEIFSVHGESYYRRLEYQALNDLVSEDIPSVIATGGGIVTNASNFERLAETATTVWLRARAEDHWDRVIQQGDRRPMRDHPQAMAELRALLKMREHLYGQADFIVDTSGVSLEDVVNKIERFLVGV